MTTRRSHNFDANYIGNLLNDFCSDDLDLDEDDDRLPTIEERESKTGVEGLGTRSQRVRRESVLLNDIYLEEEEKEGPALKRTSNRRGSGALERLLALPEDFPVEEELNKPSAEKKDVGPVLDGESIADQSSSSAVERRDATDQRKRSSKRTTNKSDAEGSQERIPDDNSTNNDPSHRPKTERSFSSPIKGSARKTRKPRHTRSELYSTVRPSKLGGLVAPAPPPMTSPGKSPSLRRRRKEDPFRTLVDKLNASMDLSQTSESRNESPRKSRRNKVSVPERALSHHVKASTGRTRARPERRERSDRGERKINLGSPKARRTRSRSLSPGAAAKISKQLTELNGDAEKNKERSSRRHGSKDGSGKTRTRRRRSSPGSRGQKISRPRSLSPDAMKGVPEKKKDTNGATHKLEERGHSPKPRNSHHTERSNRDGQHGRHHNDKSDSNNETKSRSRKSDSRRSGTRKSNTQNPKRTQSLAPPR